MKFSEIMSLVWLIIGITAYFKGHTSWVQTAVICCAVWSAVSRSEG